MKSHCSPRYGLVLVLLAAAVLGGCITAPPANNCELFEQARKSTDYDTTYVYSEAETRQAGKTFARAPRNTTLAARWYTLRTNRARVQPCDHLYLIKDLYLQRIGSASVTLEEQREFYTAKGQLIASKREDVTRQLVKSGFYTASVPLPIPETAPPGMYRVITRLIARPAQGRDHTLGTASAEFRVQ